MGVELEATVKDNFSPTIKKWNDELGHVAEAVNGLNRSVDDQAKIMSSQAAAIAKNNAQLRENAMAEEDAKAKKRDSRTETEKMSDALGDQIIKLKAQKEILQDPVFQSNLRRQQSLRAEVNQMTSALTEVTGAHVAEKAAIEASDEAVKLTVRSRRELIVLAHELSQGRYKNFGGSLMVLEEGQGGISGALKGAIAMMGGPYVAAAGAAALATAGVGIALWKASEHAAETYHKMTLLGETFGTDAQTMLGFQQLAIGTGVSVDQIGTAFARFTINLATHREEMQRIGVTARDPIAAFEQLMDVARNTADPLERDTILSEALGREWKKLAPLLMQGGEAARRAIEEMRIPPEVEENYKKTAEAQVEIDKNFSLIGKHAGESMSGVRAWFKETEAGFTGILAHQGVMKLMYDLFTYQAGMDDNEYSKDVSKNKVAAAVEAKAGPKTLSKEQQAALDDTAKRVSKDSLTAELVQTRKEFEEKASLFEKNSAEYRTIMDRELQAEAEVRNKWAKKGAGSRANNSADSNVVRNTDGSVTMRSGLEYEAGPDAEHLRNRATAERTDDKNAAKKITDAKKLHDEVQRISERNLAENQKLEANAQKIRMNWEGALLEKKKQAHEEEMKLIRERFDVGQKLASDQVVKMLHGEFTIQGAINATKDVAIQAFADTTTKWIEEQILKMIFSKSAEAANTAASVGEAAIVASAWAAPSMATSIATFGGSTATGSAAWFAAMTSANGYGMMPHERGGMMFGTGLKQREEQFTPLVPGRVSPIHNSTTNTTNQSTVNHYHFHGYGERDIQRVMRTAQANGAGVSRR